LVRRDCEVNKGAVGGQNVAESPRLAETRSLRWHITWH